MKKWIKEEAKPEHKHTHQLLCRSQLVSTCDPLCLGPFPWTAQTEVWPAANTRPLGPDCAGLYWSDRLDKQEMAWKCMFIKTNDSHLLHRGCFRIIWTILTLQHNNFQTNHRSLRGYSIAGRGIPGQWSKAPCRRQRRSKPVNLTTAGRRGQRAGRCLTGADGPTAGPGGSPGPGGTVSSPGCGLWSCPNLTWAHPGSKYLKCQNTISTIRGKTELYMLEFLPVCLILLWISCSISLIDPLNSTQQNGPKRYKLVCERWTEKARWIEGWQFKMEV